MALLKRLSASKVPQFFTWAIKGVVVGFLDNAFRGKAETSIKEARTVLVSDMI
jgi:hypothetical protein